MSSKYQKIREVTPNKLQKLLDTHFTYREILRELRIDSTKARAVIVLKEQIEKFDLNTDRFKKFQGKQRKVWKISDEELQSLLDSSGTLREVLLKLGCDTGKDYTFLNKRIEFSNLDLTKLKSNPKNWHKHVHNVRELLVQNSSYDRYKLKKRLLEEGILNNVCYDCGLADTWNGKPIVLQLDHINGTNNDNRIENLRMLCPNCHSQTKTFCGRNKSAPRLKSPTNEVQNIEIEKSNTVNNRKFNVTKHELEELVLVKKIPFTKIGKQFGVSDNAIRKRCNKYNIDWRNRKK